MSKLYHIFSQNKNDTQIFTTSKPKIMKKSKYQQNCFIVCMLVPYALQFSYQQNIVTILICTSFRGATLIEGETLIRGRRLFQCGYPNLWRLLEGGAYQRKFSKTVFPKILSLQPFGSLRRNSYAKIFIVDIKFRFSCGASTL